MKIKLSSVVFLPCLLTLIRVNWARNLKAAAPSHDLTKHDVKAATRQDISSDHLDLINQNGSSALMYSHGECCNYCTDVENIFLFLAAKSKNKNFLCII